MLTTSLYPFTSSFTAGEFLVGTRPSGWDHILGSPRTEAGHRARFWPAGCAWQCECSFQMVSLRSQCLPLLFLFWLKNGWGNAHRVDEGNVQRWQNQEKGIGLKTLSLLCSLELLKLRRFQERENFLPCSSNFYLGSCSKRWPASLLLSCLPL